MIPFLANLAMVVLILLGLLLMVIILLQRGRGGGLAGAFGGAGGQSAFGTRAGDVFTKITAILAVCWVVVAAGSRFLLEAASTQKASSAFASESDGDDTKASIKGVGENEVEGDDSTSSETEDDKTPETETEKPEDENNLPEDESEKTPADE